MLMDQFKPFVISPCHDRSERCYLLENGLASIWAGVVDQIYFECDSPCLALIDYEIFDHKVQITEVHLIATNVDKVKLLSWLQAMQGNLIGYLIILISLLTKISDNCLRADILEIIFHEELHPKQIFASESVNMHCLYLSLIVSGQKAFLKCQRFSCAQRLRDMLLVKCLLKILVKNEFISGSSKYLTVKKLIDKKIDSLQV